MIRFARWLLVGCVCLAISGRLRAQDVTVYDDALRNGFQDWSYGGGSSFTNPTPFHSGAPSISFTPNTNPNAVSFAHPGGSFTTAAYPSVRFWVHGGASGGQQLTVVLQNGGTQVASGALGNVLVAGTWTQVTVTFGSAPLSYSGPFDRIDLFNGPGTNQPTLYLDDVTLLAAGGGPPANGLQVDHDVLVGPSTPLTSDRFTWHDAADQLRVAVLAHHATSVGFPAGYPTNYGGSLREFRYQVGATTRVCDVTTYGNGGYGGFGYVVSHPGNTTNCGCDDSPLGYSFPVSYQRVFEGRHHAIFRFTQAYPRWAPPAGTQYNVPVTIDWVFSTGRDNPLWAITYDLSGVPADALEDDSRAPYGELNIDGAGAADISGVAWGDRYKFFSTTAPVTLDSAWTWNAVNTVPWIKEWIASTDATMGIVQTQTLAQQDAGGGRNPFYHDIRPYWTHVSTDVFGPRAPYNMPWSDNWPYQANEFSIGQGISSNNARLTWGTQYGFLGQQSYTTYNGLNATASGWKWTSYSTYIVLGTHSSDPVGAQLSQVEALQSLSFALTASVGSVATGGRPGINRTDPADPDVTYAPPGWDHVYGALTFVASGNALDANIAVGPGTLTHPLIIVRGFGASSATVKLGGVTLAADVDYFASIRLSPSELWITLNRNLTGATNHLEVIPGGAAPSGLKLYTATPCRVYDTRNAGGADAGAPALSASETRTIPAVGRCGIPSGAKALAVNVTVTGATSAGYLTLYPADQAAPLASSINFGAGQTRANNAVLQTAADATGVKVFNGSGGAVHVIVDVTGWFQ